MMEITVREASQRLGLSEAHICRLIEQGKIKARKLGYMWLIDANALNYSRQRKQKRSKKGGYNEKKT